MTRGEVDIDTSVPGVGPIGSSFTDHDGYPWTTVLHEIGHAFGLGHAGAYGTSVTVTPLTPYDSLGYSVMSYIASDASSVVAGALAGGSHWDLDLGDNGSYYDGSPTPPMMLDILAAQRLYGMPASGPLAGGQVFGFNNNIQADTLQFFDFTVNTKPILTL